MTAISEAQARYLDQALDLNPVWRAADVIELRSHALQRPRLDRPQIPADSANLSQLRQAARQQIGQLQVNFWKMPLEPLKRHLEMLDVQRLPELAPVVNRLRTAAACRGEFPKLAQAPWMDAQLFDAFKTAVVLPPAEAGTVRERFLNRIQDKRHLKRIKAAVAHIEANYPILYALESDWFHTLKTYKTLRTVGSNMGGTSGRISLSFDFFEIGWPAWIGIVVLIRLIFGLLTTSGQ